MVVRLAYCACCDRQVRVVLRPDADVDPGTSPQPSDWLCLEHGESCTGAFCPIFGAPSEEVRRSLEEHGLRPETPEA